MWSVIWRTGRRVIGVALGVVLATIVIFQGADKIWPGYFENPESVQLRRAILDGLVSSNETSANNQIWLSLIVRRLREVPPGRIYKLLLKPGDIYFDRKSTVSLMAEAVSGKTGLIGGRKIDYRTTCLPALSKFRFPFVAEGYTSFENIQYLNVRISRLGPDGTAGRKGRLPATFGIGYSGVYVYPNAPVDAKTLSPADYKLLTGGRPRDKRAIIRDFGSGCYGTYLKRDGEKKICVVAVAVSSGNLGRKSVTATRCRIEAEY